MLSGIQRAWRELSCIRRARRVLSGIQRAWRELSCIQHARRVLSGIQRAWRELSCIQHARRVLSGIQCAQRVQSCVPYCAVSMNVFHYSHNNGEEDSVYTISNGNMEVKIMLLVVAAGSATAARW